MNFYFNIISFLPSLIHSFHKHLASAPDLPGAMLGARDTRTRRAEVLPQRSFSLGGTHTLVGKRTKMRVLCAV